MPAFHQIIFDATPSSSPSPVETGLPTVSAGPITASGLTMSTASVLGRLSPGSGAIQELSASDLATFIGALTGSGAWGGITGTLSDQTDLQAALDAKVVANAGITGATKTKVTYDAKGLVTAGADATTADIADSTNRRYVTDVQLVVIGNTSGTNTGDQTTITGNAGSATILQTSRAIYGNAFNGSASLTQIIASTYGGTGNGFTKFSGPTTTEKTFTLPNADATLLYSGGALGTPSSGSLDNCTAVTQSVGDNSTKPATTAYVLANAADSTGTTGLTNVVGVATTFMRSDASPALDQAIVPTWTGLHSFNLIPNVAWNSMANGYSGAATLNTQYYVTSFTSSITISSYTGTPVNGSKVAYRLIDCNGSASFSFPTAQRDGDATGTTTSITPTAGTHNIIFTYVNSLWYYVDDISSNSVAAGATGATSFTAYGPVQAGATSTSALVGSAAGNTGAPFLSGGAAANGAYGALNLAGGSNVLTGVLPPANGGAAATRLGSHTSPDTTAGSITWTSTLYEVFTDTTTTYALPAASGYDGKAVIFYVVGTNAITIDPNSSEVIVRSGTVQTGGVTLTLTGAAGNYVALICDGVRWITLGFSGTLAAGA